MSLHKSMKRAENLGGQRTVLKRVERVKLLQVKGLWKEGDNVTGLPKEKILKQKKIKTEKKVVEEKVPAWDDIKK